MFTTYDYALASDFAYNPKFEKLQAGWHLIQPAPLGLAELDGFGYAGVAITKEGCPEVIVAHRGTDPQYMANLVSDGYIALGRRPPAQVHAIQFSERVREIVRSDPRYHDKTCFVETGHSLGALHAELNTLHFCAEMPLAVTKAVTFDSPGIAISMLAPNDFRPGNRNIFPITSYLSSPNVINTANEHYASNLIRVFVPHVRHLKPADIIEPLESLISARGLLDIVKALVKGIFKANIEDQLRQHALENIKKTFCFESGIPFLQARILSWPNNRQYLACLGGGLLSSPLGGFLQTATSFFSTVTQDENHLVRANRTKERELDSIDGYRVADKWLVVPQAQRSLEYCSAALAVFDKFFVDERRRNELERVLGFYHSPETDDEEMIAAAARQVQDIRVTSQFNFAGAF